MTDEQKIGMQSKRAAVLIGRFNPPQIGHYALMEEVKDFIAKNPDLKLDAIPIVVVIEGKETSKNKQKNPLTGNERIAFMKGSGEANGIRFLKATSAMEAFGEVRKSGFEPIAVGVGSDRENNYVHILDKYFKTDNDEQIKHYQIKLDRTVGNDENAAMEDIFNTIDSDLPVHMASASLARFAASKDDLEKFSIIVGLKHKPTLAQLMFKKVKAAMETQDAKSE